MRTQRCAACHSLRHACIRLLARSESPADPPALFVVYDHVRVPRTMRSTEMSREQGKLLDFEGDGLDNDLDKIREALQTRMR